MNKDFIKGISFGLGILLVFSIVGLVSAVGFHYASEVLPGNFSGNYNFLNGNIGVGTDSPQSKLEVKYNGDTSTTGTVGLLRIVNDGGTFKDYASIVIQSDPVKFSEIWQNPSTNAAYAGASSVNVGSAFDINLGFVTNNQLRMIVDKGGNVGIGTKTPTTKLDVNGKITMRNQTVVGDSVDTVTTKKYVDDAIVAAAASSWVNGNVAGNFDINCEYRVKVNDGSNNVYFYINLVKPTIIHGSSNHYDAGILSYDAVWINSASKNILWYSGAKGCYNGCAISGVNVLTTLPVIALEKLC